MAATEEPRVAEPAPEQPSMSRRANYTTNEACRRDREDDAPRSSPPAQGAGAEAPTVERRLDEVLLQIRKGWKDRRLADGTIHNRESVLGMIEGLAEKAGCSVVTEGLVLEAALLLKERYPNEQSRRTYLQALREICLACGIYCSEVSSRPLGPAKKTIVPAKFEGIHKAYREYLGCRGYAASTVRMMERAARQILCFLGTRVDSLDQVTEEDLEAFLADRSKSWSAHSLPTLRRMVRGVSRYLVSRHGMPESSCRTLAEPMRVPPAPLQVIPTEEQVARLLDAAATTPHRPKRTLAWVSILVQYAVRSKDLVDLKLGDIEWARGTITFAYTKTGSPRTFPLTEGVRYALLDYLRHERPVTDSPYVFLPRRHPLKQISNPECFTLKLKDLAREAGLDLGKRFGCHALRRASATALLEGGLPYGDISRYLNHLLSGTAISGVSMRYLKIHFSRLRTAALEVPHVVS